MGRGQRLHGGDVAAGGHDHVRGLALVVAGAAKDADALGAVRDRLVDGGELQVGLLVRDDHVDVVGGAQAVVGHREEAVGVRRQVDARDGRALVGDHVHEAGVLVREAIVVLPPDRRGEQDVLGGDRGSPRHVVLGDVEPLGVLVEHGVDDVGEGLVGVEEAVTPGEQVALQPSEQRVLGEHLHDAPVAGKLAAVGVFRQQVGHPGLLARAIDRLQSVR